MSIDTLIAKYIQLRDKKAELKAAYDAKANAIQDAIDKLDNHFLKELSASGADRIGTPSGVVFKSTRNTANVADKELFREFLLKTGEWALADLRVAKTAVAEFIAENDDLPPGINWRSETVVRVNRA